MAAEPTRVAFRLDATDVVVDVDAGEMLLTTLRERLGVTSAKDGCAPQGQCGCCTVLVDGSPRVSCVTPVTRVAGRAVTTVDGLDADRRDALAAALCATGGSQCGFCTPGIVVRLADRIAAGRTTGPDLDRALAAHLCRCTGWQTIHEAVARLADPARAPARDRSRAAARAALEGHVDQRVDVGVPLGRGGFADDTAPRDALVAVPLPPGSDVPSEEAAGRRWVVADGLGAARERAGKVQGRRVPEGTAPPLPADPAPLGGVTLATGWVEPAYLEPDASWCAPGGDPASPLGNGGAFGGKVGSIAAPAARELADRTGRPVRVVFAREDVVRLGPKRPPVGLTAVADGDVLRVRGRVAAGDGVVAAFATPPGGHRLRWDVDVEPVAVAGPPVAASLRAVGWAELAVLAEGALQAAGLERSSVVDGPRTAAVLLATAVVAPTGAAAGARVSVDGEGRLSAVHVRVAAGDPLDATVLRAYAVGAAHMALGWVLSEGLAVDPVTGDVGDLTIRSFGVIRPQHVPPILVEVVPDAGPALPGAGDAAFAAVAAATWLALADADGVLPPTWPARGTRAGQALRR
jgi:xanthine dehydrogenase small subunit